VNIVSWTLANENAPALHDALKSADGIADACLVVWTGSEPSALGSVPDRMGKHAQVHRRYWRWRDSFAAARNAALDFVCDMGAEWSCMVDSDESIVCKDPIAFRAWLFALPPGIRVALAHAEDGSHTRERFFRSTSPHYFKGRTHEVYPATMAEQAIIPRELITWSELPKTQEQLCVKFARDVQMLQADIADDPKNGAAYYYLGASLQSLAIMAYGDKTLAAEWYQQAIDAFRSNADLDAWEGGAWSCFKAAECYIALGQPNRALDCAAAGLVRDAGIGELYWIAGVASLLEGRHEQARCWAMAAKAHGIGSEAEKRRRGFRLMRGLTTGPDEVLADVERSVMYAAHGVV